MIFLLSRVKLSCVNLTQKHELIRESYRYELLELSTHAHERMVCSLFPTRRVQGLVRSGVAGGCPPTFCHPGADAPQLPHQGGCAPLKYFGRLGGMPSTFSLPREGCPPTFCHPRGGGGLYHSSNTLTPRGRLLLVARFLATSILRITHDI